MRTELQRSHSDERLAEMQRCAADAAAAYGFSLRVISVRDAPAPAAHFEVRLMDGPVLGLLTASYSSNTRSWKFELLADVGLLADEVDGGRSQ